MTNYADFGVNIAYSKQGMELQDRSGEQKDWLAPETCLATRLQSE